MHRLQKEMSWYVCAVFVGVYCCLGFAQDLKSIDRPMVVIPKISGKVDLSKPPLGGLWRSAAWVNNFVPENQSSILKQPTRAGLMYDDKRIYIGVIMDNTRPPIANSDRGDTGLMRDDAVEVILKPPGFRKRFGGVMSLTLNPDGLRDDGINYNFKVNFKWDGRVFIDGNRWMAIFAVPFKSIGFKPKTDERWGFNIARFIPDLPGLLYRPLSWSPVGMNEFHSAKTEGHIIFGGKTSASKMGRITVDRNIFFSGRCADGQKLIYMICDERNNIVRQGSVPFVSHYAKGKLPYPPDGKYTLKLAIVNTAGKMVNVDVKPIVVEPAMEIKARRYPVHGTADLVIKIRRMKYPDAKQGRMKVVWFRNGEVLGRKVISLSDKLPARYIVDLGKVSPGKVLVRISVTEKNPPGNVPFPTPGSQVVKRSGGLTATYSFIQPKCPIWANNKIAEPSGEPIVPWPALKVMSDAICPWGRKYDFGKSFLPVAITSQGHQILAKPTMLDIVVDGSPTHFKMVDDSGIKVSHKGGRAVLNRVFKGNGIKVNTKVSVDYDGMMWFDIKISGRKKLTVDKINIEIPMKNEFSTLQSHWPYVRGEYRDTNSMPVGNKGLKLPFRPVVWLGSTEAGLEWFAESDKGWKPANDNNAIEIVRRSNACVMILHYQDNSEKLQGDKHICFGLMASPVKPWPVNYYEDKARILSGMNWGYNRIPDGDDAAVWYPLEGNISLTKGRMELWIEPKVDLQKYRALHLAPAKWVGDMKLLRIDFSDGAYLELKYAKHRGALVFAGRDKNHKPWLNHQTPLLNWKPGTVHRISLSWSDSTKVFVDGRAVTRQPRQGLIADSLNGAKLKLGGIRSEFYLHAIRISSKPQGESSVNTNPVSSDDTLFLDTFNHIESVDGKRISTLQIGKGAGHITNTKVMISPEHGLCLYNYGARTLLNEIKDIGAKYLLFFETWTNVENSGTSPWEDGLREMAWDIHKLGMKFFLYFGFNLGDVPEMRDIIDECKANPDEKPRIAVWQRPKHPMYTCSYASPYQDYIIYNVDRLKRTVGIDGVYLDGAAMPLATTNIAIGNGYRTPDGRIKPIYTIHATRRFVQRLRNIFSAPDNIIVAHGQTSLPTLSCVDLTRVGENLMASSWDWRKPTTLIPLPVAKTIYYGRTFGIPQRLDIVLKHSHMSKNYPNWEPGILALAQIHDNILVTGVENSGYFPPIVQRVYRDLNVRTEFDASHSRWYPYWKVDREIRKQTSLKISLWKRNDGAVLAVVSNLTDKKINDIISFPEGSSIKPKSGLRIYDAVQDKAIGVFDGKTITISVPAFDYRIIRIGQKKISLHYTAHYDYLPPNAKSYYFK